MGRWPDFFIIGAGRSGTTSLYYYLRGHPQIFLPAVKEPHFFNDYAAVDASARFRSLPAGTIRHEEDYLALFEAARPEQRVGEASVSYIADKTAASQIRTKNPDAKIIAVLREPVDRAYSAFLLARQEGREKHESFHDAVVADAGYAEECYHASIYVWPGLYYRQLKLYFDTFPRDQIKLILFDDLDRDTFGLVESLCAFLDVPFGGGAFFDAGERYHAYGTAKNPLLGLVNRSPFLKSTLARIAPMEVLMRVRDRFVDRSTPKPQIDAEATRFLKAIFREDTQQLQTLIGRDLSAWLK